jgi:hypothetical protein|tara:strand:- start:117 stop:488 length:372 start_codon:yes stop_codon:yes gene_type:complete
MAITFNTDRLQGLEGTTINGVYGRIQIVTVKKFDATTDPDEAASFRISYDVVLHATAVKRNAAGEYPQWGNRLRSREIDHFTAEVTADQMNAADANGYTLAYADLKAKLAAGDSPIASSIQDA